MTTDAAVALPAVQGALVEALLVGACLSVTTAGHGATIAGP